MVSYIISVWFTETAFKCYLNDLIHFSAGKSSSYQNVLIRICWLCTEFCMVLEGSLLFYLICCLLLLYPQLNWRDFQGQIVICGQMKISSSPGDLNAIWVSESEALQVFWESKMRLLSLTYISGSKGCMLNWSLRLASSVLRPLSIRYKGHEAHGITAEMPHKVGVCCVMSCWHTMHWNQEAFRLCRWKWVISAHTCITKL